MKYEIRTNENGRTAIFDESGIQISEWWNDTRMEGLVNEQSDFYLVIREDNQEAIFHKSGIQVSEWWTFIWDHGLVKGTSNQYKVYSEEKPKTLTFSRTKFIMDMIKEKLK
ncbi:MAG: hypothetical protein PF569_09265 [Candidatus Woesearchaeota archaeon]|jgi:hypothetical protein|nr:hypothetical protein [Candidatus Woesearchaeota archaeon]